MSKTTLSLALAFASCALAGPSASAEIIELVNGAFLQGDVESGRTTDEGLALQLYDTGGVVVVKWDHIVESRRRELRRREGIDLAEETEELVQGHRVRHVDGSWIEGVAENPRGPGDLRMRTRTGVKEYPRSVLAGPVLDTTINGLLVYTREELYQRLRDADPPQTAAAHKALAQRCINIGAYDRAKEHLVAAREDAAFRETSEGRAIEPMMRNVELMLRAQGAADLKTQILQARAAGKWNEAKRLLEQLAAEHKDPQIRNTIGFDLLEARILKGRDTHFQREIALEVYRTMDQMILEKAREQKPLREDPDAKKGTAVPGSLAAARQWLNRDLDNKLWEKVGTVLGLGKEEMEQYWNKRSVKNVRRASYGGGSFVVVKKDKTAKAGSGAPQRRPPGSEPRGGGAGKNVPAKPAKPDKPLTEEQWFEKAALSERANWLKATFVQQSGRFEIVKTEDTNCVSCGGLGHVKSLGSGGGEEQHVCTQCNAARVVRTVSYR